MRGGCEDEYRFLLRALKFEWGALFDGLLSDEALNASTMVGAGQIPNVGHDDQVPLFVAVWEFVIPGNQGTQLDAGLVGIRARDTDSFGGRVEAGNIPSLRCQVD